MQIRRAKQTDIDGINFLLRQVLEIHAEGRPDIFIKGRKKYSDAELKDIIADDNTPIYVAADDDGRILGYAFCIYQITKNNSILRDRKTLYIDDLCVDEACRGRHIGTALFEYVNGVSEANACDSITLNVWSLNETAMKFYEKCGFTPLKTVMEKKLK